MKKIISPDIALQMLMKGNHRFTEGFNTPRKAPLEKMKRLANEGQTPYAVLLTCSDSRVPAEIIFDCDFGDVFIVRVAGNIVDPSQIASIEYACTQLGSSLVVVMGHTKCGAIQAASLAMQSNQPQASAHLEILVNKLMPAVEKAKRKNWNNTTEEILELAIKENVRNSISTLQQSSPILTQLVRNKGLAFKGAVYNIQTGIVTFDDGLDVEPAIFNPFNFASIGGRKA